MIEKILTFDDFKANFAAVLGADYQHIPMPDTAQGLTLWGKLSGSMAYFYILYDADQIGDERIIGAKEFMRAGIEQIAGKNGLRHCVIINIPAGSSFGDNAAKMLDSAKEFAMMPMYDAYYAVRLTDGGVTAPAIQPPNMDSAQAKIAQAIGSMPLENKHPITLARPRTKRPYLLFGIIAANIILFILMELSGGSTDTLTLLRFGAAQSGLIFEQGQYWRLLTPIFLHIGLMHLAFNTGSLIIFASYAERYFGHWRFAVIYILSGAAGSLSMILINPGMVGAGASGSIFGAMGAVLAFMLIKRQNIEGLSAGMIAIVIASTFFMGFAAESFGGMPSVAHAAHGGGLVVGFLSGAVLALSLRDSSN